MVVLPKNSLLAQDAFLPMSQPEILRVTQIMRGLGWLNLFMSFYSVWLLLQLPLDNNYSCAYTAMLSLFAFWVVGVKIRHLSHSSRTWMEISVTLACGLYLPFVIFVFSFMIVLNALTQ